MLEEDRNQRLMQVGAETPMGKLMRRYWHPIAAASEFEDAETGELHTVNTADARFQAEFTERAARVQAELGRTLRHSRVDVIDIQTDQLYVQP